MDARGQPRNAVRVMYVFGAILLCTILPSAVAFSSLVSAGGVPTIAAYGLIALLRLTMTPDSFRSSHFGLGKFAKPFYISAVLFNALIVAVSLPRNAFVETLTHHLFYVDDGLSVLLPRYGRDLQLCASGFFFWRRCGSHLLRLICRLASSSAESPSSPF